MQHPLIEVLNGLACTSPTRSDGSMHIIGLDQSDPTDVWFVKFEYDPTLTWVNGPLGGVPCISIFYFFKCWNVQQKAIFFNIHTKRIDSYNK